MPTFSDQDFPWLGSQLVAHQMTLKTRNRAKRSTTINDLPDELLVAILEYIPGIDALNYQLQTLCSVSRVNHRFHGLTIPYLYTSYNSNFCEPYLFLRSVTGNADLATLVRHVDVTFGSEAFGYLKRYTANAQDKKMIKEGLRREAQRIPDWKNWATKCNAEDAIPDTLHTAILMQTCNITSMNIYDSQTQVRSSPRIPRWLDLLARDQGQGPLKHTQRFAHLGHLHIEFRPEDWIYGQAQVASLAPVFQVPSLRKLSIKNLIQYDQDAAEAARLLQHKIQPHCNHLDELHLTRVFFQNDILKVLAGSARALKILTYDITTEELDEPTTASLGTIDVLTALEPQKSSLQRLTFCSDDNFADSSPPVLRLTAVLREYATLTTLQCPLDSFLVPDDRFLVQLAEKLPPSLHSLDAILRPRSNHLLPSMASILRTLITDMTTTPQASALHSVRLILQDNVPFYTCPDVTSVDALFAQAGIRLTVEAQQEAEYDQGCWAWATFPSVTRDFHAVPGDDVASESSGQVSLYSDAQD
ncbi:hypothetical protein ACEQ8H_005800 [Pleosporales sp. CAS-2024a]